MNYYLSKYVGTYRIKAEIDRDTNDFPRDQKTNELINNQDIYIKCANKIRVYYYGSGILEVYIPSIIRGKNIVKKIYADFINSENVSMEHTEKGDRVKIKDQEVFESDFSKRDNIIFDIQETDQEVLFKIKDKNFSKIIGIIKPQQSGANISPFSSKNLPKKKSVLSGIQIDEYRKTVEKISKENFLKISQINNRFLSDIMCKKLGISMRDAKAEMKKELMKIIDYISFKGFWGEYIQYLQQKVDLII